MTWWEQEFQKLPGYAWIAIAAVVLTQGVWLFVDARKHSRVPWFWGIWGLISFPLPSILYLIFVRKIFHSRRDKPRKEP